MELLQSCIKPSKWEHLSSALESLQSCIKPLIQSHLFLISPPCIHFSSPAHRWQRHQSAWSHRRSRVCRGHGGEAGGQGLPKEGSGSGRWSWTGWRGPKRFCWNWTEGVRDGERWCKSYIYWNLLWMTTFQMWSPLGGGLSWEVEWTWLVMTVPQRFKKCWNLCILIRLSQSL